MVEKEFNVIELFSGAGGLALGLHLAGFEPLLLVDFFEDANETVRKNLPHWNVITEDIVGMAEKSLFSYIPRTPIDLMSAGFPCQPFSYAGKRLGLADTRGTVFYSLSKIIEEAAPKVILLENVRGLLNHDKGRTFSTITDSLYSLGYVLDYRVLNAWNYNVPQKRQRLFIVGVKNLYDSRFEWPDEIHPKPILRDALKDVPISEGQAYPSRKKAILDMVPPGGSWVDLPDDLAREYLGKSYFSGGGRRGMARRLSWDEPSLTLTCSPAQKQTERCHPDETRPLTVREYARIQTFPDDYAFYGSMSSQYKQIGNAVPVQLAYHMGLRLMDLLRSIHGEHK